MAKEEKDTTKEFVPGDKPVFFWQAVEFESNKKPSGWLTYLILIAVVLIAAFIYMKLWLAAAVVVAACFALYSQAHTSGKKKSYAVYDQGITIEDKVYAFDQFKSFWVIANESKTIVRFEQLRRFALPIEMPTGDEDPEQIRLFLSKHLPEAEDRGEDIADRINKWIKF